MAEEDLRLSLEEAVGEAWGDVDIEGNGILDAGTLYSLPPPRTLSSCALCSLPPPRAQSICPGALSSFTLPRTALSVQPGAVQLEACSDARSGVLWFGR